MKKRLIIIALLISTISIGQAVTVQQVTWIGKAAVGGYAPEGTLNLLEATASLQGELLSKLNIIVDMRTLEQENTQLRDHLREKDFFHIEKFPVAVFSLTEAVNISEEKIILKGNMTIRGKTVTESIPAIIKQSEGVLIVSFDHVMDRTAYGIVYNSPSVFKRLKDNAIADEFQLKGEIRITL